MARSGVQYEDVHRVIHQLLQQGEAPAVQKIREVLGTGSFTTISEHLRQWKIERAENRDQAPIQALPDTLQRLTHELWQQAQALAHQGLLHYREEADRQVIDAQKEASDALRQAEDARQRESATANHLTHLQTALEEKSTALTRAEMKRETLSAALDDAGQKLKQLEGLVPQLDKQNQAQAREHQQALKDQATQFETRLAQEEQRHEATEARLMSLVDSLRQERQAQEKQHAKDQAQWERRLKTLEATLAEQRETLEDARQAQRGAEESLARYQERETRQEQENQRLREILAGREAELAATRQRWEDAQQRLARVSLPPFTY
ncbi:DNA-binding protein [Pistricoccus aurantiacus]|uniref:DNA-binding protein n=1 Tax=Pistricoccus aurantiacus TaxID=1883414 RepID=UPI00362D5F68